MTTRIKVTKNGVTDLFRYKCVRIIQKMIDSDSVMVGVRMSAGPLVFAFEGDSIVIDGDFVTIERG